MRPKRDYTRCIGTMQGIFFDVTKVERGNPQSAGMRLRWGAKLKTHRVLRYHYPKSMDHLFISDFCWHNVRDHCTGLWSRCEVGDVECVRLCHEEPRDKATDTEAPFAKALMVLTE